MQTGTCQKQACSLLENMIGSTKNEHKVLILLIVLYSAVYETVS